MRALSASPALDIADTARLFVSANLASADGAIGCWDSKYHWKFWRPIMAIREADRPSSGGTVATSAATAATREDRLKVRNGYMSPRNRRDGRPMVRRETHLICRLLAAASTLTYHFVPAPSRPPKE
jgi:hypothetical protein